ncbi:methyltransferase [Erysipelotrichaceae bacterium MTC7]|nr:methyltransferase [Erysipelotrichaceae bacterium MTC7]
MSHYYEDNKHTKSNRKEFSFRFWCFDSTFISDHGVFSKDGLDEGTKVLLSSIENEVFRDTVLDLGCGLGIVGILMKKRYPDTKITMVDVNDRALLLAKENAQKNQVDVETLKSDGFDSLHERRFESIITNPPIRAGKQVVYKLLGESYDHLQENGRLYFVMRKSHGAKSAQKYVNSIFGNCTLLAKDKGFYVYMSSKKLK